MKKYVSLASSISVYRFMELCGLYCEPKKKKKISHGIMMRKLEARYEMYPDKIIIPTTVSFSRFDKDELLSGDIVMVKDELGKVKAYKNPQILKERNLLKFLINSNDKNSLNRIREKILEEQGYVTDSMGEIIPIEENDILSQYELEFTEKLNRANSFFQRSSRSLKRKKH